MKRIITSLAFIAFTLCAQAQATFVQTVPSLGNVVIFSASGEKIYGYDASSLYLYNMDGSTWKTINFPSVSGYTPGGTVFAVSDNLFNSDNLVEAVVVYNANATGTYPRSQCILINETGAILQHIDTSGSGGQIHYDQGNNTYQLYTYYYNAGYHTNIYSLTGTIPCGICGSLGSERLSSSGQSVTVMAPYPNPSSGIALINYNLPGNTSGELVFYAETGEKIKEMPVFSNNSSISVNNSGFRPGTYNYNIISGNNVSNTQTMVVK